MYCKGSEDAVKNWVETVQVCWIKKTIITGLANWQETGPANVTKTRGYDIKTSSSPPNRPLSMQRLPNQKPGQVCLK